jgi:hypothetical protein
MNRLYTTFIFVLGILAIVYSSCKRTSYSGSEDCNNYDYSDCNTSEPLLVALNIKLTINDENSKVALTIYEGKIEDQLIVLTDTVSAPKYNVLLPSNKYYSVKVRYKKGNQIIYAFGGDKIKSTRTTVCDSSCWSTDEGNVNVELKN